MKQIALSLAAALLLLGMVPAFACEGENMLYEDSFDKDDGIWHIDGDWVKLEDGKLIISPQPSYGRTLLNQAEVYDDVDVCVTMTVLKEGDQEAFGGLVFWAADHKNKYDFVFAPRWRGGGFAVTRHSRGKWFLPVPFTESAAIKRGVGEANHLRVVAAGRQAKVFINGEEVASFKGSVPKGGSLVGLLAEGGKRERVAIAFDDFKVAEPVEAAAMRQSAPIDLDASLKAERKKAARAVPPPQPAINLRALAQPQSVPAMKKER